MSTLKYIVGESGDVAIFSPTAVHANVARTMMSKPAGAGFLRIDGFEGAPIITCYGESVSLNVKSRNITDAEAIYKAIYE